MADGHCASTDCDDCAAAFEGCGGFTDRDSMMAQMAEWAELEEPTEDQQLCMNKADSIAFLASAVDADACAHSGGTWTTPVAAVVEGCAGTADTSGFTTGETACTDLAAAATCSGDNAAGVATAGPSTASQGDCEVVQGDAAVVTTFTAGTNGECTGTTTASGVAVATCTTACVGDGLGAGTAPNTNGTDCNDDAATNTWLANGTCADAAGTDIPAATTAADCTAANADSTEWTPAFVAATTAVWNDAADASGGCAGAADATTAGDFGDDCTATKAFSCVGHYSDAANADCWADADPSGSADGSDASPASMLQVGAAVLASLAMLL